MDMNKALGGLRRDAILTALYASYPQPQGLALLSASMGKELHPNATNTERALDYLADRQWVTVSDQRPHRLTRLTPKGIDEIESRDDFSAAGREACRLLRLRILQALDWGRPQPLTIVLIQRALREDEDLDLTTGSIMRAIRYLHDSGLAEELSEGRRARIKADGIDYLANEGPERTGIMRPLVY